METLFSHHKSYVMLQLMKTTKYEEEEIYFSLFNSITKFIKSLLFQRLTKMLTSPLMADRQ